MWFAFVNNSSFASTTLVSAGLITFVSSNYLFALISTFTYEVDLRKSHLFYWSCFVVGFNFAVAL